jgi:biotin operon repressor
LDSRNKKSTDDSVDKLYRSWLDTKAGLIEILAQAAIAAGPGKDLEVKPLRKIISEAAFPWGITAKDTAQYLIDQDYKVEMQIRCAQSDCNTLNDFSLIFCSSCKKDIGDGHDYVICPHGHEVANLSRFCKCKSEIQYRKPVMPIRISTAQPTKKSSRVISMSILETRDMIGQGMSLSEVAEQRGISGAAVRSHVDRLVKEGHEVDLDHLMPSDDRRLIIEAALKEMGDDRLSRIHTNLGSGYTWDELAVVRMNMRQRQREEPADQDGYTILTVDEAQGIWSAAQMELNKHDNRDLKKIGDLLAGTTIDVVFVDPKRLIINFQDLFAQREFFRLLADPVTNKLLGLVIYSHFGDKYDIQGA